MDGWGEIRILAFEGFLFGFSFVCLACFFLVHQRRGFG